MDLVPVPLGELLSLAANLERSGRTADAERMADHVLAAYPKQPEALHLKGLAACASGRETEAVQHMEAAIAHGLEVPLYYRNICALYERLGRLDEAVTAGKRAVLLDPTDAQSYHNLTVAHARRLELDESIACARTALALDRTLPGAHFALAEALLLRGDLPEGWAEYEWRFRIPGAAQPLPATDRPAWDGTPLPDRTLLLVADQGFGDVIQFGRYLAWVATLCPRMVIACSPEMQSTVRQMAPNAPLFTSWAECPEYAAFAVFSGLPRLHGTTLTNVPSPGAYLQADPERVTKWRQRLARLVPRGHRAVGLAWAGRPAHSNDRNRSAQLNTLRPLFDTPNTTFVALQKGPAQAQIGRYFGRAPLINLGTEIEDFADTAAILHIVDLLITVDTSVGHLAGALGRPAWIMLPYAPDWRWLLHRTDTPWYNSVRLFRQPAPGDWTSMVNEVATALTARATGRET